MADLTLRQRLRRLFSTSVIIRNIGGNKLKVADINDIQRTSLGYVNDRYMRLYGGMRPFMIDQGQTVFAQRLNLFKDYEAMDQDPIISSALDIYADESTMKNEVNDVLRIKSPNNEVRSVLENLFNDILNIEFNLWPWIRNLTKYGDFFLQLDISEEYGITNIMPLSPYEVSREEGYDQNNPQAYRFNIEGPYSGKLQLDPYQIAHFRLLSDSNYLPYGKSMVEGGRRVWKQLALMEDAMLLHRIMRAPEKRIFKIDIGNIPPESVDAAMERIINQVKKVPYVDPNTGEYNLKFNLNNMIEDFYLPVRGGDSGTQIDTLSGMEFNTIDDIDYLRNKMLAALKIPKAFLGYEEQVGSKATLAAEDVRFARTIERIQKIVVSELTKIAIIHLCVQGFKDADLVEFDLELTNPSTIYEQEKIELWNSKIALARDIKDIKMLSQEWVYDHIFNMGEDEVLKQRKSITKDLKRAFRFNEIENQGNDPAESGQAFTGEEQPPAIEGENINHNLKYDDLEEIDYLPGTDGRRGQKIRTRRKEEPFGEDPIGQKDYEKIMKVDQEINHTYKHSSPLARSSRKSIKDSVKDSLQVKKDRQRLITEVKNYFLDEKNIIDEEDSEKIDNTNTE